MTTDSLSARSSSHDAPGWRNLPGTFPGASSWSTEMPGGADAPARARRSMLAHLPADEIGISSDDISLIISELVTNSVTHARVDASRQLTLSAQPTPGGWRIAVSDPGSNSEPHIGSPDAWGAGGMGLRLVERLCTRWGTFRDSRQATHVWCDLPRPGHAGDDTPLRSSG